MTSKKEETTQQNNSDALHDYLVFDKVTKQFGNVVAVDHLTLSVSKGEFIVLLGPSGCGKTTTLRLVAGLERPTEGRIFLQGKDITQLHPRERNVAMVFQDYALYPHMTLFENIAYPLKLRKIPRSTIEMKVIEVANRLGISELLNRRPGQVSGGQQQRAAVARALVYKPKIFLFDEPLSNLDAKLRLEARAFLQHLCREEKITTIYVTHDQAEAMALADRIGVMDHGKLLQIDNPLEIYHKPKNVFVAGFIGNPPMNLLPCILKNDGESMTLVGDGFKIVANFFLGQQEASFKVPVGRNYVLGFRPEHAHLLENVSDSYALCGHVYAVQPLGAETLVTVKIGNSFVSVRLFTDKIPSLDEQVCIQLNYNRLYIFSDSGDRIWP